MNKEQIDRKVAQVLAAERKVGGYEWELGRMYLDLRRLFLSAAPTTGGSKDSKGWYVSRWDTFCRDRLGKRACWVDGYIVAAERFDKETFARFGISKAIVLARSPLKGGAFSAIVKKASSSKITKRELQVVMAEAEIVAGIREELPRHLAKKRVSFVASADPYEVVLRKANELSAKDRGRLVMALLASLPAFARGEAAA